MEIDLGSIFIDEEKHKRYLLKCERYSMLMHKDYHSESEEIELKMLNKFISNYDVTKNIKPEKIIGFNN